MFARLRATLTEKLPFPRLRAPIRQWRRSRPFFSGLLVMFGGTMIILVPLAPLPIMLEIGWAAIWGVTLGLVMIIGGLFFWFTPENRVFVACITAACSVLSLVASNLGGFIIGMLAGIIGSCLAFAWTPDKPVTPKAKKQRRAKPHRRQRRRKQPKPEPPLNPLPWDPAAKKPQTTGSGGHPWPTEEPGPDQRPYR